MQFTTHAAGVRFFYMNSTKNQGIFIYTSLLGGQCLHRKAPNTLGPEWNDLHFVDDVFKYFLLFFYSSFNEVFFKGSGVGATNAILG